MPKKAAPEQAGHRGVNDIVGIVLMGGAVLLLVSLLSYDPHDISKNYLPANNPVHNWVGPVGSWVADVWIKCIGLSAYAVPFLLIFLGLGCFFELMSYLRRRWLWSVFLLLCCTGLLGLYDHLRGGPHGKDTFTGGFLGSFFYKYVFSYFGMAGSSIILFMLAFISCLYLTNFRLGHWIRAMFGGRPGDEPAAERGATNKEIALEKRKSELERQLAEHLQRSGQAPATTATPAALGRAVGADYKPVPEPTVRDLSVPQSKAGSGASPKKPDPPSNPRRRMKAWSSPRAKLPPPLPPIFSARKQSARQN